MKRFRSIFIMLMVCASALVATSCEKEISKGPDRSLSVSAESLSFVYGGESKDVTVSTDYDKWSVNPNVAWITVTKGDGKFTATARANNPGRKREAVIVITAGAKRHEIKVEQGGNILSLSAAKRDFAGMPATGQTAIPAQSVNVEVIDKQWTAEKAKLADDTEPTWFDFTVTATAISITVVPNPWPAQTREGKIYVQMENYKDSIVVAQSRAPNYEATIAYTGRSISTAGVEEVLATVTFTGSGVDSARVALVPGTWTAPTVNGLLAPGDQEKAIIEEIANGTRTGVVALKAGGTVRRTITEAGTYTYVVVTFCKDKILRLHNFSTFKVDDLTGGIKAENYYGNYTFTATSILANPNLSLPVTISEGATANDLVISGIEFTDKIAAKFNPANGTITITPPQTLPNLTINEIVNTMALWAYLPAGTVSNAATSIITLNLNRDGSIVVTSFSVATGYVIRNTPTGGAIANYRAYRNLVFTPR